MPSDDRLVYGRGTEAGILQQRRDMVARVGEREREKMEKSE